MMKYAVLIFVVGVIGLVAPAWASDIIRCNPADPDVPNRVSVYQRSANTQTAWLTDPTYIVNPSSLPSMPRRYWKCADTDADGMLDSVVEMTQAEKDIMDAPMLAEQQRIADLQNEVTTNDLCTATLDEIDQRIDNAVDNVTNMASAKTFMRRAFKKVARCLKVRVELGE